jgi:hypothetical protein
MRGELVFHAVVVGLGDLAFLAVEHAAGQVVTSLGQVGLGLDLALVGLVVGQAQDVQGLEDPSVVRDRLAERGGGCRPGRSCG